MYFNVNLFYILLKQRHREKWCHCRMYITSNQRHCLCYLHVSHLADALIQSDIQEQLGLSAQGRFDRFFTKAAQGLELATFGLLYKLPNR